MSFVKLTVVFYVTHTHTMMGLAAECSRFLAALIQFRFDTTRKFNSYTAFGSIQIEIFIYRVFDTLFAITMLNACSRFRYLCVYITTYLYAISSNYIGHMIE